MKTIETKSAPAAIGPYSQAILANWNSTLATYSICIQAKSVPE